MQSTRTGEYWILPAPSPVIRGFGFFLGLLNINSVHAEGEDQYKRCTCDGQDGDRNQRSIESRPCRFQILSGTTSLNFVAPWLMAWSTFRSAMCASPRANLFVRNDCPNAIAKVGSRPLQRAIKALAVARSTERNTKGSALNAIYHPAPQAAND